MRGDMSGTVNRYEPRGGFSIPLNEKGVTEYDYGVDSSENLALIELPFDERTALFLDGVFDRVNEACGICIEDYERCTIPEDEVRTAIKYVDKSVYPTFYAALEMAIKYKSFCAIDL